MSDTALAMAQALLRHMARTTFNGIRATTMKFAHNIYRLLATVSALAMHHPCTAAAAAEEGKKLYHAVCSMCHGTELNAAGGMPDLRMTRLDDQAFTAVVREGRPGTIMPPMKSRLSDEEIGKIRAYIKSSAGG